MTSGAALADTKISALPNAAALGGTEQIPAVQSAGNVALTPAQIKTYVAAGVGANPTASVGLAAVNGSASTFLRSDGAPALDQSIVPTWTGLHTFSAGLSTTVVNKVTLTQPATGSTLTVADGKTLTASRTLTLTGTDATTMTFPTTSATLARTDVGQTFTGSNIFNLTGGSQTPITISGDTGSTGAGSALVIAFNQIHTGTNKIQLSFQGRGSETYGFGVDSAGTGSNVFYIYSDASSTSVFSLNGVNASFTPTSQLGFASTTGAALASPDAMFTRRAAANINLGAADAAAAVAQALSVQGVVAGTTNTAGAKWTLSDSVGTGTGPSGGYEFDTHPAGTTGTAQNAAAAAFNILTAGETQHKKAFTVSALPTCNAGEAGAETYVTDASGPTYLGTLTGGSSTVTPVMCNGTAWVSY